MVRLARLRRRTGLFAALVIIAALTTALAAGIPGWIAGTATAGVRGALAETPAAQRALALSQTLQPDATAQDRDLRAVIAAQFGAVPIEVHRRVEAVGGLTTADPSRDEPLLGGASMADLPQHAVLEAGTWPADAQGATIQADAARTLGLRVGDTVEVGGVAVTLTGLWRADAADPVFLGDDLWLTGAQGTVTGPVVFDESLWSSLRGSPTARWVVVPEIERMSAGDLATIYAAWTDMPEALRDADRGSVALSGRFLRGTAPVAANLAALQTAVPLSLVIVAAIAALALWELLGLLARSRAAETALLWSRGATPRALAASAAVESGGVALAGGVVGAAAATGLVALTGVPGGAGSVALAAFVAVPIMALVSAGAAWARTRATVGDRRVRRPRLAGAGVVVLLCAGAAVATWQLLSHGAVTRTASGGFGVDPVAVLAPGLLLVAAVSVAVLALPFVLRWMDAAAARSRGDALAVRGVTRRVSSAATTVVAVGLAVGQIVIAAGYAATWSTSFTQTQALHAGAPLRIDATEPLADGVLAAASAVPGVTGVAPVPVEDVSVGSESVALIGVAPAALRALAPDGDGAVDAGALADAVDIGTALPALPGAATSLTVDFAGDVPRTARAWIVDAWGVVSTVDLAIESGSVAATASVPRTAHGPWRLLAVDAAPTPVPFDPAALDPPLAQVTLARLSTDAGEVSMPRGWTSVQFSGDQWMQSEHAESPSAQVFPVGDALVRFVPAVSHPIVLSTVVARRADLSVGTRVGVDDGGAGDDIPTAEIVALTPAVPGSADAYAALADARAVLARALARDRAPAAASTAWVAASGDVAAAAQGLRDALPADVEVRTATDDPDVAMLGATAIALWAATAGCLALAVACLVAACAAQSRERRDEVAVLRSLGLRPARQGALRRTEQWMGAAWGALAGIVAGGAVVLVPIATLARAGIPAPYPDLLTSPRWDPAGAGAALAVLAAAVAVVIAWYGVAVVRQARRALPGGG